MATGFSFGTPATSASTGGFSFGTSTPAASTAPITAATGFGFGTTPAATAAPTLGGFGVNKTTASLPIGIAAPNTASTGFNLGGTAAPTTGFNLGGTAAPSTGFNLGGTAAPTTGFNLGGTAAPTTGFNLGGTAAPTTGFNLGGAAATTTPSLGTSTGFSLAPTKPTLSSGLTFNTSGLSLGTPATTASTGLKLGGTTAAGGLSGGLFGQSTTSAAPNIFNTAATATTASVGLGGVDPKTSTTSSGGSSTNGKSSDVKALKETFIPDMLVQSVDGFGKYIKDEKTVREGIARMSSKPIIKVQEDTAALKQLLSVVSNTLQRNTCAVDKLKREMTQELKNAEMAHRTKDTPPGLQYENTAPTGYFQALVEDFENRMLTYRQQIEVLENHLASLYQPNRHSPAELIALLRKLHETFIALAAQLQQVHEAVKTQKEHYLNYRKIFHGDSKNIFEKQQKVVVRTPISRNIDQTGPNPFTGVTNAAAAAMASVLTRSQQPTGAPPVVGLSGGLSSTFGQAPTGGFGLGTSSLGTSTLGTSTLGGGLFGGSALGTNTGSTSIFGNSSSAPSTGTGFNLGTSQIGSATSGFGSGSFNLSSSTNQPFTLDKPPAGPGGKRNKR